MKPLLHKSDTRHFLFLRQLAISLDILRSFSSINLKQVSTGGFATLSLAKLYAKARSVRTRNRRLFLRNSSSTTLETGMCMEKCKARSALLHVLPGTRPLPRPAIAKHNSTTSLRRPGKCSAPPRGRSWYATEQTYLDLLADDRIWFPKGGDGSPRLKLFAYQLRGLVPFTVWGAPDTGTNDDAKRHLMAMFPEYEVFDTPKPESQAGADHSHCNKP